MIKKNNLIVCAQCQASYDETNEEENQECDPFIVGDLVFCSADCVIAHVAHCGISRMTQLSYLDAFLGAHLEDGENSCSHCKNDDEQARFINVETEPAYSEALQGPIRVCSQACLLALFRKEVAELQGTGVAKWGQPY